jgi:peptide/nickel transport system ATP-binding protein
MRRRLRPAAAWSTICQFRSCKPGETLCIAGESGSGKSMTALALMGLLPQPMARVVSGSIALFEGTRSVTLPTEPMRSVRGSDIAMIFQEPMTSSIRCCRSAGN